MRPRPQNNGSQTSQDGLLPGLVSEQGLWANTACCTGYEWRFLPDCVGRKPLSRIQCAKQAAGACLDLPMAFLCGLVVVYSETSISRRLQNRPQHVRILTLAAQKGPLIFGNPHLGWDIWYRAPKKKLHSKALLRSRLQRNLPPSLELSDARMLQPASNKVVLESHPFQRNLVKYYVHANVFVCFSKMYTCIGVCVWCVHIYALH